MSDTNTIRAFLAVELPGEVREALVELTKALSAAGLRGVRLVRPEGVHLTLKFLGDIDEDRIIPISDAVSRVAATHGDLVLELSDVGAFPNDTRPRVLWIGLAGETGPLLRLQKEIDEALATLGFERERRSFTPHLTVARVSDGTSPIDRVSAVETLNATTLRRDARIPVKSVSLIRSIFRPGGAEYERLVSFPLGRSPGVEAVERVL